jgi:uncharacterized membrane protein YdjX (TVP38/TMEM64 family)
MPAEKHRLRFAALAAFALLLVALSVAWKQELLPGIDAATVEGVVAKAGPMGPVLVIALMMLAVVASPIPSAPIALAAGAAYGHYAGTLYVAVGSEAGALVAFVIARYLGRDTVERWLGSNMDKGLLGSQNALTLTVFGSRLLPFVSFDAMSYAAGLSRLHLWRFLLATLAGILPASFLLAHFGAEAVSGDIGKSEWIVLALGLMTALPLVFFALKRRSRLERPPPDTSP